MTFTRRWRQRALLLACLSIPLVGCSADDASTTTTPLTKADVAEIGGFDFPSSTAEYRSTRDSDGSVYVTFTLPADDLSAFTTGSGLELEPGRRVIVHASPIWDQNPTGDIAGGDSVVDGVRRQVETVRTPGAEQVTVRMSLDLPADAG